jgi:hypothetical protein
MAKAFTRAGITTRATLLGALALSGIGCSSPSNSGTSPVLAAGGNDATAQAGTSSVAGMTGNPTGGATGQAGGSPSNGGAMSEPDAGPMLPLGPAPDFGPNVLIFDPTMSMATIQSQLDGVIGKQASNQFGTDRYAYFFKPGSYSVDVKIGFYMQVLGLGQSPNDVQITGGVRSKADWFGGNATLNFWRAAENFSVTPTTDSNTEVWAVSQGTALRRAHVKASASLSDGGYSSGGFIADSAFDGPVTSGTQQQFFSRNTTWAGWGGGVWNMVFSGIDKPPQGAWPTLPYTVLAKTPLIREKPYLTIDSAGHYFVMLPAPKSDSTGNGWAAPGAADTAVTTDKFYVAKPTDTAATINAALAQGKHLLLTPGVYQLEDSLQVTRANTIVFGLGLATLVPSKGTAALTVADVDGVDVSGIIVDAGPTNSTTLLQIGPPGASASHSQNPSSLHDISCRVGGATAGTATSCVTINSSDVIGDDLWMWRADHGAGANWGGNVSKNGLIVNGNNVTMYGLFVEHFQEYQTLWNGNGGRLYFYQSEMPYDPPSQAAWQHDGVNGYASYKVADAVTTHEAWGLGTYCSFHSAVVSDNSIETPTAAGVSMHHMMTSWLNGTGGSGITHIVNGTGSGATQTTRQATSAN